MLTWLGIVHSVFGNLAAFKSSLLCLRLRNDSEAIALIVTQHQDTNKDERTRPGP